MSLITKHGHSRPTSQFVTLEEPVQIGSGMPDGWRTAPLRSLCLATELTDPAKRPEIPFQYVDVSAVSNELWRITGSMEHLGSTAPSRARKVVKANDVIFATVRPTLKRIALVPDHLDGQIISTAFCVLRADPTLADSRFIYYSLLTDEFIDRMANLQRGASYPAVSDGNVLEQKIAAPPLPEQRAIAAVLSKIQAAVEVQDKIIATLKELKAATMAKLFREGLHGEPLKQTEIGEIPESWEVTKVGDLLKLSSGATRPGDLTAIRTEATPFPVYGGNGVMGYSSRYLTERQAIVIGRVGVYCGSVHVCSEHSWVTDNALYNRDPVSERVSLLFLAELLAHMTLNRLHRKGAQPLVTQGTVHNVVIQLPPKPEQEKIARTARLLSTHISRAETKLTAMKALLSSMLYLLTTGQVRVRDVTPWVGKS